MNGTWIWVLAAPLWVAPPSWAANAGGTQEAGGRTVAARAQEAPSPDAQEGGRKGRLTRVDPAARGARAQEAEEAQRAEPFDREAWRTRLAQPDLDERSRDFDRLVELAREDRDAREALEAWSRDAQDHELAWTSRLALREVERAPRRLAPPGGPDARDLQSRFDDLQRQFGGMDSMFSELQSELDRLFRAPAPGLHPHGLPGAPGGGARSQAESFSLEIGPDGVKAHVTEERDGEQHTREYTADSLEELLEAHPELRDRVQAPALAPRFGPGGNGGLFRALPIPDSPLGRALHGAPPTDILGIRCTKMAPEKLRELGLQPEQGVLVDSVVQGTIAQILGIRRGDLILEINQQEIFDRDDIGRVMRERGPAESLAVLLIDGKGQRRTLTWNPEERHGASSEDDAQGAAERRGD